MNLKRRKRIFLLDDVTHKLLKILSAQVDRDMSSILADGAGLLSRLLFCHKCDLDLQFDPRFDAEIYQAILERYHYADDKNAEKEFREKLIQIKRKTEEGKTYVV